MNTIIDIPVEKNFSAQIAWVSKTGMSRLEWPGWKTLRKIGKEFIPLLENYTAERFAAMNRAKPSGFLTYWTENPLHFEDLYKVRATSKNIQEMFQKIKEDGHLCAAFINPLCACRFCKGKPVVVQDEIVSESEELEDLIESQGEDII